MSEEWSDLAETPEGWVIAAGRGPFLEALSFPYGDKPSALWIAEHEHPGARAGGPADLIQSLKHYLEDYFAGRVPSDDLPVRLDSLTPFTQEILSETAKIPWGTVCSYQELAIRVGRPLGARAAGQALGRNPVPIIVPCHRVVASTGGLGGFGGGLCWKRKLLKLEGLDPDRLQPVRIPEGVPCAG